MTFHFRSVYFIQRKSEVPEKLKQFVNEARMLVITIQNVRCDGCGEFDNFVVKEFLQERGIQQLITMPYTPQQNGSSERENRTIVEAATLCSTHMDHYLRNCGPRLY